ncbi:MFS transporter [Chryseobacterium sp. S-02]|uniref:MFS transporter n=1 Tax=unclassified Chryseobacterium TaxID=2593645 RepID=UPI00285FBA97|nr:MFS transporter [Chryseobacterium sp. 2987]MDR6919960.1 DHA1 family arabinose polymer transporter-like MFS transporter [Chryseobacterium sp. 2987]
MNNKFFDKRILPLAVGGLGIGTTEFAIMGLLPYIAKALKITIPEAGHFISAYAMGVVIGAPIIILLTIKYPPKKVLFTIMLLFAVFNGLSAVANTYSLMLISRFLSGLPHGAFFGISTVVASGLAKKGKQARYISMVFSGLTLANLAMVPLMTYIGHVFRWNWAFAIVSIIGIISSTLIILLLPNIGSKNDSGSSKSELLILKKSQIWYVIFITATGFGGLFAWLSYISPLTTEVSQISIDNVPYVMILAGAGMVTGNLLGGYLCDKIGAAKAAITILIVTSIILIIIFFFSHYKFISYVFTFLCGALSFSLISPANLLMFKEAPGSEMISSSFMQAAFNISNALGAYLGGIPLLFGLSYSYPSLVGAGMTLIGLCICLIYIKKYNIQ